MAGLLLSACHAEKRPSTSVRAEGPTGVVRVALTELPWPLDPALARSRDEIVVARALFATPLRTDPGTGALAPGLCTSWSSDATARSWRFRCTHAGAIAAQLRRASRLAASPGRWLFAGTRIAAPDPQTLVIRLAHPWRRFAYTLTTVAAAPRGVPGPFRLARASPRLIVAERPGLRLVFRRLDPHAASRAFRRGEVDEAPVPLGSVQAARADPGLRGSLRVSPLFGVDLVAFQLRGGVLARNRALRRAYWETAPRADYEALVPEHQAAAALGFLPPRFHPVRNVAPHEFRSTRDSIGSLPRLHVPIGASTEPDRLLGAELAAAHWRELGLGPTVQVLRPFEAQVRAGLFDAWFGRLLAPYPQPEALLAALLLPLDGQNPWFGGPSPARRLLLSALAARDQRELLVGADAEVRSAAAAIPLAWVADARLVSPRLRGWRRDVLGSVDYTRVRAR